MSKQKPYPAPKSFFDPSESDKDQDPMSDNQPRYTKMNGSEQVQDRMETFPKTNTFPRKWDLSSFSKDSI